MSRAHSEVEKLFNTKTTSLGVSGALKALGFTSGLPKGFNMGSRNLGPMCVKVEIGAPEDADNLNDYLKKEYRLTPAAVYVDFERIGMTPGIYCRIRRSGSCHLVSRRARGIPAKSR